MIQTAISPLMPFPPVGWWTLIAGCREVHFDLSEAFRKMSYRNRYRIATANGPLLLSVPLTGGRDQRTAMGDMKIDNRQQWQKQHWRSVFSAYGRSPFYEYYGPELEALYLEHFEDLAAFNLATIRWVQRALKISLPVQTTAPGMMSGIIDTRPLDPDEYGRNIKYPQVFEDRNGFIAGLSILDLLMNEGPASPGVLTEGLNS